MSEQRSEGVAAQPRAGDLAAADAPGAAAPGQPPGEELRRQWEVSFRGTSRGIAIVDPLNAVMRSVNPALAEMHGGTSGDLVGRPLDALLTPEAAEELPGLLEEAGEAGHLEWDSEHQRRDGTRFPVHTELVTVRDDAGRAEYRIAWFEDRSAVIAVERERARTRRDFEIAFRYAPNGMAVVDLDGGFVRVNPTLCEITGHSEEELLGMTFRQITHPEDLDADLHHVESLLAGEVTSYETEKRYFTKEGHLIWVMLSSSLVRDDAGRPEHFIVQIQDISQRKRMEASLRELADKDTVTGLINRRRFEEELSRQAARCERYGERVALVLLDLDKFKQVNDTRGHKAGDRVIRAVGRSMLDRVRASDIVARIGGDEFALLLLNLGPEEATMVAEEVRARIERDAHQRGDQVTASVGVVHVDGSRVSAEAMLVAADLAMYEAKRGGRNRVAVGSV